jgi:hypothetical protein
MVIRSPRLLVVAFYCLLLRFTACCCVLLLAVAHCSLVLLSLAHYRLAKIIFKSRTRSKQQKFQILKPWNNFALLVRVIFKLVSDAAVSESATFKLFSVQVFAGLTERVSWSHCHRANELSENFATASRISRITHPDIQTKRESFTQTLGRRTNERR